MKKCIMLNIFQLKFLEADMTKILNIVTLCASNTSYRSQNMKNAKQTFIRKVACSQNESKLIPAFSVFHFFIE